MPKLKDVGWKEEKNMYEEIREKYVKEIVKQTLIW